MREFGIRGIGGATRMLAVLLALLMGGAEGCVYHHYHRAPPPPRYARGHGPPPHAPAHGYRYKHPGDDVVLVFDAGLGVYAVLNRPGYYWQGGHYWLWLDGEWRSSARIDAGWVSVAIGDVPPRLAAKYTNQAKKKKKKHHRGHGPVPARFDD